MKICRFRSGPGEWLWGELMGNELRELHVATTDPLSFRPGKRQFPLASCELTIPALPTQMFGIGDNFHKGERDQLSPVVFAKPLSSLVGNHSVVMLPKNANVWGEPEIGVVIRKTCHGLQDFTLSDYVLGYCLINDTTALFEGKSDSHTTEAKGQPGFCQVGEFINTSFDYEKAVIEGRVNGGLYRRGATSSMKWNLMEVLRRVTATRTLVPGDIIFTGTPERVSKKRTFLKNGDEFEVYVEGLGSLKTRFKEGA